MKTEIKLNLITEAKTNMHSFNQNNMMFMTPTVNLYIPLLSIISSNEIFINGGTYVKVDTDTSIGMNWPYSCDYIIKLSSIDSKLVDNVKYTAKYGGSC